MADISRLPSAVAEVWDWQLRGLCRTLDTAMFFHPDRERGGRRQRREDLAKAVCAQCPVLTPCREHALAVREPYGIWGGMTERERESEIRARHQNQRRGAA